MTTEPSEFAQIIAKAAHGKDLSVGASIRWLADLVKDYKSAVYNAALEDERESRYWDDYDGR